MSTRSMDKKFAVLTRDIDWQRASFLSNILEIVCPPDDGPARNAPAEMIVRRILDHYLLLALLFYRQLRTDLKQQWKDKKLSDEEVTISLQRGLDKLVDEWDRVFAVSSSVRTSHSTGKAVEIMRTLQPVQNAAMKDAYLSSDFQAVLHFGQSYSMRFFKYIDNMAALNMPLAGAESPWEWTILWHELAHEKIRSIRSTDPFYFDTMLASMLKEAAVATPSQVRKLGWSAEWLEEMFADSFSVANFPIHFLYVLKNQLGRYYDGGGSGSTHPFTAVRLAVGMSFHLQRKGFPASSHPRLQEWETQKWRSTWRELDDPAEKLPQRFAQFDPAKLLSMLKLDPKARSIHLALIRLTAQKILEWHDQQPKWDHGNNSIQAMIAQSIKEYSQGRERGKIFSNVLAGIKTKEKSRIGNASQQDADHGLRMIEQVVSRKTISRNDKILDALETQHQGIARLLRVSGEPTKKLGYQDLLMVAFDDDDYADPNVKVSKVQVWDNSVWSSKFSDAVIVAPIMNAAKGDVSFHHPSLGDCKVSKIAWNKAAKKPDFQI